jgi:hypothetical protein
VRLGVRLGERPGSETRRQWISIVNWSVIAGFSASAGSAISLSSQWRLSDQHNSDHGHASFTRYHYQLSALIRSNSLRFCNNHETQIRAVAVDNSNAVIQIREPATQCSVSTHRNPAAERSGSQTPRRWRLG